MTFILFIIWSYSIAYIAYAHSDHWTRPCSDQCASWGEVQYVVFGCSLPRFSTCESSLCGKAFGERAYAHVTCSSAYDRVP